MRFVAPVDLELSCPGCGTVLRAPRRSHPRPQTSEATLPTVRRDSSRRSPTRRSGRAARRSAKTPAQPSLVIRLAVWFVCFPLALVLVAVPARHFGYLNSQRLLDVVLKPGLSRYLPLVVIGVAWALTTAVLVQLAVGLLTWFRRRRAVSKPPESSDQDLLQPGPRPRTQSRSPSRDLAPPQSRGLRTTGPAHP
jgi:hypothetical protein